MACVYALYLKSLPEEIRYIGMTKYPTAEERFKGHIRASVKSSTKGIPVYDWIRKHGTDQIEVKTLYSSLSIDEAKILERTLITKHRKIGTNLLNCNDGGEGAFNPTKETRDKISNSRKGKPPHPNASSPEARAKISAALKGRVFSEEWKRKLSESRKNLKPISEETRKKMSISHEGIKHTQESKDKMSVIRKARPPMSEEQKKEISAKISKALSGRSSWNKGKKMSEEARKNMSKAALNRSNNK